MESLREADVVLLGWCVSMFTRRVKIALAEKGIKYEYIEEQDVLNNKSPLLLQLNPLHKLVPVLIHNGKPICESKIIVEYLDHSWKNHGSSLLPSDPYLKSQAVFWADYIDKKIYPFGKKIMCGKDEEMKKGGQEMVGCLKVLEEELGDKPYFMGENFGFVDIAFICYYNHFYTYEILGNFNMEKDCPKLFAWATRCMQRESVSETRIDKNKIYETTTTYRKAIGLEN